MDEPDGGSGLGIAFEQGLVGAVRVDAQGCILAANDAFAAPLGYAPSDLVGLELTELASNEDSRSVLRPLLRESTAPPDAPTWSVKFWTHSGAARNARLQVTGRGDHRVFFVLFVGDSLVPTLGQAEVWTAGQAHALELMAKGAPLSDVLDALCDVIEQRSPEPAVACISLIEDDLLHLRPIAGRNMPKDFRFAAGGWPIGDEGGVGGRAAARRELTVSPDIAHDTRWSEQTRALAAAHGFASGWATPIVSSGGEGLGAVVVYHRRAHAPHPSELGLGDIVARTAGIAIERKRGEEGLRTHSERLRLLWETAAVLMTAEEPEALIHALFVRIAPHLGLDVFLNHMVDEVSNQLQLFSFTGVERAVVASVERLELDSPYWGGSTRTHEPYATTLQHAGPVRNLMEELGIRAYACFPLLAGERVLGTLSFGSKGRPFFEIDEVEFMRTLTRYLTVAYERLRLVKQLREADRQKDNFMALLAHELRNPLAPLRNGLAIMRLSAADAGAVARARAIMERQVVHMVRLIDDLMDVSRISLNKMQLQLARVTLDEVIAHAIETARPAIDAARHQLSVDLPVPPTPLHADLTRMAQVFGNLLTNAAKYTPEGGQLSVRAVHRGEEVVVTVADDGIGLSPESIRVIFGMFSQVDHSLVRATGGLGIGLALVKGLTEIHGGKVRAESEGPGKGSRFIVTLPLNWLGEGRTSVPPLNPDLKALVRRRILLAEDNRDAAESLAATLRLWGHEVQVAHDGLEVVERAEQTRPDVILMDVGMPYMDGYEATRQIRARAWGAAPVIIALTGWGHDSARSASRAAGCDEHLVKPVDLTQLFERVTTLSRARPHSATA